MPRRSGHAQLRHPALQAMSSLRDQTDAPQPSRGQRSATIFRGPGALLRGFDFSPNTAQRRMTIDSANSLVGWG